jgi:hypothetical protein
MANDRDLVGVELTVVESMAAHSAAIKRKQSASRAAARPTPVKPASRPAAKRGVKAAAPKPDARIAALLAWRKTATAPAEVLEVVDAAIRRGTATPRTTVAKAGPSAVAAFFASTGLSRKQIADAVGVSTSVIGTVQKENGDRWSLARFEAAKPLILAAAKKLAAKPAKS